MPVWKKFPPDIHRKGDESRGKKNQHLLPAKFTHNPIIASMETTQDDDPTPTRCPEPWPSRPSPWSLRSVALPGLHSAVPRAGASDAKVTTRRVARRPCFLQRQR